MLVLSRKIGESIVVGDVTVYVVGVQGKRVRLGIEAPPAVAINRAECPPRKKKPKPEEELC